MGSCTGATGENRRRARQPYAIIAVLAIVGSAPAVSPASAEVAAVTEIPERPNIVLILTDDQRFDTLWAMPQVQSLLVAKGMTFQQSFVVNPICCPSRVATLTGLHSHSNGVWSNIPPHGGFPAFQDQSTLATWLDDRGYRTGLIGKYLNGYGPTAHDGYIPPGWDRWVSFAMNNMAYYDYHLTDDGQIRTFGSRPQDYATDVLARRAEAFIRNPEGPFFLYFSPPAPHGPWTPAPRHAGAFSSLPPLRPVSYNEKNVSDKPQWAQWPPLSGEEQKWIDEIRRNQLRTLLAVDQAVGRIIDALRDTGQLSKTMIVFTSDNGFLWGEHRWRGKQVPYEESIRVPLVIRFDPITSPGSQDRRHMVLNIDLAPTFADIAGATTPAVEGRSLLPLLLGQDVSWRTAFLVEHVVDQDQLVPTYVALRTEHSTYVEYATGDRELYDLDRDPSQLQNIVTDPAEQSRVGWMHQRLDARARPRPPGF